MCNGIRNGTPLFVLQDILSKMPEELEELYSRTLQKIESGYAAESYVMLQIALCAIEPLPLDIFLECVDIVVYGKVETKSILSTTDRDRSRLASRTGVC
jgi:hypothetical protein